ncbi:MAG: YlbF family regulator [Lachnospiraceae bacterium]|nr:YlbF family regulator [Lachnospiraceae bacterium]
MDTAIRENADRLIEAIRNSSDYRNYQKCEAALDRFPGVFDQIMELRKKTIELYESVESGDLSETTEALRNEYEQLEKIPEVNAFLEAEENIVQILKELNCDLFNAVTIRVPNI